MIGNTTHVQLTNGKPTREHHETGLSQQGLPITHAETIGLGGSAAPKADGSFKGDRSVPAPGDGEWTCHKCKVKNEDGRIICKGCGTRG